MRGRGWRAGLRAGALALLLLAALPALGGCGRQETAADGAAVYQYSRGQVMLVAATERNRYQNIYTGALWQVGAGTDGETFEQKLKNQIGQFLVELATVDEMAREQGLELTGQEEDDLKSLSRAYYEGLSQADRDYMGATEDDVYQLYCRYFLANKLVSTLTGQETLEVSDAEAKVIHVQRIALDSREEAETVLAQARDGQSDFAVLAERDSQQEQIDYTLKWSEGMDALDAAAFALEQDEIGEVVEAGGLYYVQKCVNAYDEEATAARKEELSRQKKAEAFRRIYEPYAAAHPLRLEEDLWEKVDFSQGSESASDNFFSLYQSRLGGGAP